MKARIEKEFAWDRMRILVKENGSHFSRFLCASLSWKELSHGTKIPDDFGIYIDNQDAFDLGKALFEAAIEAGIVPDLDRVKGELQATKIHLADLQKAFNKLLESK